MTVYRLLSGENPIGRLVLAAGLCIAIPQLFTARPAQALFAVGLLLIVAGGLLIVDELDELEQRERFEEGRAAEIAEWARRDREDDYTPATDLPGGPTRAA